LAEQTAPNYKVPIIDDCFPDRSVTDGIRAFIRDHGNMWLIENERNIGFARTCNEVLYLFPV